MIRSISLMSAYANSDELDMAGKVDRKVIDLRTGENFDPEYIKIVSTPYTLTYSAPSIAPIFLYHIIPILLTPV